MEVLHAIVHLLVLPFVLIVRMGVACRLGRGLLLFLVPGLLTLEAAASQDRELQLSWLRYWVVVSLFLLVEPLLDLLPLPFLTIAKLVGLAWCLAAEPISGSRILFDQIHPIWEEGRTRLDLWAKEASGTDLGALLVSLWQQKEDFLPLLNTHVLPWVNSFVSTCILWVGELGPNTIS